MNSLNSDEYKESLKLGCNQEIAKVNTTLDEMLDTVYYCEEWTPVKASYFWRNVLKIPITLGG